jgi:hypothetical protein
MPLVPTQHIISASGLVPPEAGEALQVKLESLPLVKIVSLTSEQIGMYTVLLAVVEEV